MTEFQQHEGMCKDMKVKVMIISVCAVMGKEAFSISEGEFRGTMHNYRYADRIASKFKIK